MWGNGGNTRRTVSVEVPHEASLTLREACLGLIYGVRNGGVSHGVREAMGTNELFCSSPATLCIEAA